MNELKSEIVKQQAREIRVVEDDSNLSYLLDTGRFEHAWRIAGTMAAASLIPQHLRGKKVGGNWVDYSPEQVKANCFLVVNQSFRWGFDPFAVAPETYEIGGKLAYQGKLVIAAVNRLAGLKSRLNYSFDGQGQSLQVTIHGTFKDEQQERVVTLKLSDAKTSNDMWTKDPEQKLIYSGSIKWARRHCPEVVLGVMIEEDNVPEINVTPTTPIKETFIKHTPVIPVNPTNPEDNLKFDDAPQAIPLYEQLFIRARDEYGIQDLLAIIPKDRKPRSAKSLSELTDENLKWIEENFTKLAEGKL